MNNIGILTASRSESHLTNIIYLELEKLNNSVTYIDLSVNNIPKSYYNTVLTIKKYKFDFILAVGDRTEQIGGVLAAYQNNIPIGHLYAGDHNRYITTFDDIYRHNITLFSNIQLCSSIESYKNTVKLKESVNHICNTFVVGATQFDQLKRFDEYKDIFINPFTNKDCEYNIILLNSETKGNDINLLKDVEDIIKVSTIKNYIIVKSNEDKYLEVQLEHLVKKYNFNILLPIIRLKHKDFLTFLANCDTFITNSSSAIYEAPELLSPSKIMIIGDRNKNRTLVPHEAHDGLASFRIAKYINEYLKEVNNDKNYRNRY